MDKNEGGQNRQGGLSWSTPQNQTQQQKPVQQPKLPVPPVQQNANPTKYASMVVAGIIAGVLLAWGWSSLHQPLGAMSDKGAATSTGDNLGVDTSTLPAMGSNSSLSIVSPQAAGDSVAITKAVVSTPTWVVIYEDNAGHPGNALGAALFFPDSQTGAVELLRATTPGKTYFAAEQVDNGDRKFSLKDDQFLTEGGQVQWVTFETN